MPIGFQVFQSFLSLRHMQVDLKRIEVNDFLSFNLDSIFFDTVKFCAFFLMIRRTQEVQFDLQILSRCYVIAGYCQLAVSGRFLLLNGGIL